MVEGRGGGRFRLVCFTAKLAFVPHQSLSLSATHTLLAALSTTQQHCFHSSLCKPDTDSCGQKESWLETKGASTKYRITHCTTDTHSQSHLVTVPHSLKAALINTLWHEWWMKRCVNRLSLSISPQRLVTSSTAQSLLASFWSFFRPAHFPLLSSCSSRKSNFKLQTDKLID